MKVNFYEKFGEELDDEKIIFSTNTSAIPKKKDTVMLDETFKIYTVKDVCYCYDEKDVEPIVEIFVVKQVT